MKQATISSFTRIIDQLLELALDSGLTVQEFNLLLRQRAVHAAANRVLRESGRISKSRVAILTGLPRSEVTKILTLGDSVLPVRPRQNPAEKILACWYEDPRFLGPDGQPEILPVYGNRGSFERLVTIHGSGIPVRAMLDALIELNAIETLPHQHVRAKSRIPISSCLSAQAVSAVGDKCSDLLSTLIKNMRERDPPLIEATVAGNFSNSIVPLLRRELAEQATSFINAANSIIKRAKTKRCKRNSIDSGNTRLGVSVYYFEQFQNEILSDVAHVRKNLRRHRGAGSPKQKSKPGTAHER